LRDEGAKGVHSGYGGKLQESTYGVVPASKQEAGVGGENDVGRKRGEEMKKAMKGRNK
jgi:hypothetical protein